MSLLQLRAPVKEVMMKCLAFWMALFRTAFAGRRLQLYVWRPHTCGCAVVRAVLTVKPEGKRQLSRPSTSSVRLPEGRQGTVWELSEPWPFSEAGVSLTCGWRPSHWPPHCQLHAPAAVPRSWSQEGGASESVESVWTLWRTEKWLSSSGIEPDFPVVQLWLI